MKFLDYEGLQYFYQRYIVPLQSGGGGISGLCFSGEELSPEAITEDPAAEYKVIQKSSSAASDLFTVLSDTAFGTYSCIVRAKVDQNSSSEELIEITVSYVNGEERTVLKTVTIKAANFNTANTYQTLGFVFEFSGTQAEGRQLEISAKLKQTSSPVQVSIDYMLIERAAPAIYSLS